MDAADVTANNSEALSDYPNAQKTIAKGHKEDAILLLRRAVRIDPDFALAYAQLGDNLVSLDQLQEGYQAYSNSLNAGSGQRLSRRESDFIKGSFASDTRDYASAEEAFRDYSAFYENDFVGWFYQAYPLDMLDPPQNSVDVLMRANQLSPSVPGVTGLLIQNYLLLGDFEPARRSISSLRNAGKSETALYFEETDDFLENKFTNAEQSLKSVIVMDSPEFQEPALSILPRVYAEEGKYKEALKSLAHAVEADKIRGD